MTLYTALAEELPGSSIAFPVRLRQGLLQQTDDREAYLTMIAVMARTPCGSWPGHPLFGFNEFFLEIANPTLVPESRQRIISAAVQQVNTVLTDLGLTRYQLEALIHDAFERELQQNNRPQWSGHEMDRRGVTAILRESSANRAIECAL
jgi:hypothetical protein